MSIAVSIFISQADDGTVRIQSLAADDAVSKGVEKMLTDSAANVLQYMRSNIECAELILRQAPADGGTAQPAGNTVKPPQVFTP